MARLRRPRARWSWNALFAIPCLQLMGCTAQPQGGRIGVPGRNSVRILARHLKGDANTEQWLWTVVGDRNWTTAVHNGDTFRLSRSYPLNSTTETGGTHVWEFPLTLSVDPGTASSGSARLDMKL